MRLLLWVAVIVIVLLWLQHSKKARVQSRAQPRRPAGSDAEAMVQCAHCGVHIPASEALAGAGGAAFCCEEHRARH